jgi:predicted aldo/keto reductase-like oxidoreductase
MRFRKFGKLDWPPSALGFGCMRLPTRDGKPFSGEVIEDESIRIIRLGIDRGVNYVDSAYGYHNGNSELVLGKALLDGYRQKVMLATKSPVWAIKQAEDFDRCLGEQLKKLQTDHIDFYLFHGLGAKRWHDVVLKFDLLRRAEAAKQDGRIGHIGFSFHDQYDAFQEIVDGYDQWEFCQIQYNYLDIENQAGTKGLQYAASKGLAVVVMEPLMGGKLARPPAQVQQIFDNFEPKRTPADWALQWVWNQPEVSLLLSGMSSARQVEENLASAERSAVNSLDAEALRLFQDVRQAYKDLTPIPCTQCGYCMPCPSGVDIPTNLEAYNNAMVHNDLHSARFFYQRFVAEGARASACTQCQECDPKCTQGIIISEWMPKVDALLGAKTA